MIKKIAEKERRDKKQERKVLLHRKTTSKTKNCGLKSVFKVFTNIVFFKIYCQEIFS